MNELHVEAEISFFRASGQSMWPFIREGERLIVKAVLVPEIKAGDIIVYQSGGEIICHRVTAKRGSGKETYYLVRGDCARGSPERVEAAMIVGRVCGIVRGGRFVQWQGYAAGIANRGILIVAPLIALICSLLNHFQRRR